MAIFPRTARRERIQRLCTKIDNLVYRQEVPSRLEPWVKAEIDRLHEEINQLNELHPMEHPSSIRALGAGSIGLIVLGLLMHTYGMVTVGLLLGFVAWITQAHAPQSSGKNRLEWKLDPSKMVDSASCDHKNFLIGGQPSLVDVHKYRDLTFLDARHPTSWDKRSNGYLKRGPEDPGKHTIY